MAQSLVIHALPHTRSFRAQARHAVDDVHDQVEPIEVVQHHHVERGGRGPLLFVPTHVDVVVIRAAVGETVDEPRITVIRKDHRAVGGEHGIELGVRQPMGMFARGLQAHQVDHVHDTDFQARQVLANEIGGGQHLKGRDVAGACEHDIGLAAHVGARPIPDAESARAVRDRLLHREVVERRLLARDDHVDVVAAAQAVVGHRQQAVRVRRQVHANHLGLLIDHVVDEPWVLVREAVVVLPPDM